MADRAIRCVTWHSSFSTVCLQRKVLPTAIVGSESSTWIVSASINEQHVCKHISSVRNFANFQTLIKHLYDRCRVYKTQLEVRRLFTK